MTPRAVSVVVSPDACDDAGLCRAAATELGIDAARVTGVARRRRTIDARRGRVRVRWTLEVWVDAPFAPEQAAPEVPELPHLAGAPQVAVIGAGPAGLFAAWQLARRGVPTVLLERGADVRGRRPAVARLNREGALDPETNYCFGEGGAGTFSDGKLYTRVTKRGPVADALALLVACGAPPSILVDARPHIGTNRLPNVVIALRERLVAAGVDVRFGARVDGLKIASGRVEGVTLADGATVPARAVVLATGHSARDVYRWVVDAGVACVAKPFALGVRVEHPQGLIDRAQYGEWAGHPALGAAPYALKTQTPGGAVFSFCMCPGGFIVAAATEPDGVVVNGMSPSRRDSRYANSGLVVALEPGAGAADALAGVDLQRGIERAAFAAGGGAFRAPAQRITDYLAGRDSADLPPCSYRPGLTPADLRAVLPPGVDAALRAALRVFDRQIAGYVTREAVLVGVESRSSAPIRVLRDAETLDSPSHPGLYPCGEGAGYAGGIISAALDGWRVADAVADAISETGPRPAVARGE